MADIETTRCRALFPSGLLGISVFVLALALRLALATRGIDAIDRLFLPDDTYYSLSIARQIALGHGPSADGVILTNGFQPLVTFLQVPFFWLGAGPDQAVRAAVIQTACIGAGAAAVLATLLARVASWQAGALAGLFVCFNPTILCNDLNGLETSLAILIDLAALHALVSCMRSGGRTMDVILGALLGLSLLARIDNCFFVLVVGAVSSQQLGPRRVIHMALAAFAAVTPWWLYSLIEFGTFVPESGAAVKQIVQFHLHTDYDLADAALSALSATGRVLTGSLSMIGVNILAGIGVNILVGLTALCALVYHGGSVLWARDERATIVKIMIWGGMSSLLFYALYLPAIWFFPRYFALSQFAIITVAAVSLAGAARHVAHASRVVTTRGISVIALPVLILAFLWLSRDVLFFANPSAALRNWAVGSQGYRANAIAIIGRLPPHSTLGAMQSGALGYYAGRDRRVVNLDGVVNIDAYRAIRDKQLRQYMASVKIGYFADWDVNLAFLAGAFDETGVRMAFTRLYTASSDGREHASLYRLDPSR